jgi:DNA polymerase III subunit delta'
VKALARAAAGRLDRARRLLDPAGFARRETLIAIARSVYRDPAFEPADAAAAILAAADERSAEAREREQEIVDGLTLPTREAEQRVRRAGRGAERDELLSAVEGLEAWYRDLMVVGAGAEDAAVHGDRLSELREDVALGLGDGPLEATEIVRELWRALEEFNLNASLAFEALFVRVSRVLRPSAVAS